MLHHPVAAAAMLSRMHTVVYIHDNINFPKHPVKQSC